MRVQSVHPARRAADGTVEVHALVAVDVTDEELACLVQQSLRQLAKVSSHYVEVFASRPGARLAGHVRAGYVDRVSRQGRLAMRRVYLQTEAAAAVGAGLNTNDLLDRITGRGDAHATEPAGVPT